MALDLSSGKIKIFADGADLDSIREMMAFPIVKGFTTNPTLMRKAGVTDYKAFALDALAVVGDKPLSLEVFADDFPTMEAQALEIASWGKNVNVKIPVTNTRGESSAALIRRLSERGVICNVTAIFTMEQFVEVTAALHPGTPTILSVFAGRIADAGVNPEPLMRAMVEVAKAKPKAEVLWASPREIYNIFHADDCGCHIITITPDLIRKAVASVGKDLAVFSLETVAMFYRDASAAGYAIQTA